MCRAGLTKVLSKEVECSPVSSIHIITLRSQRRSQDRLTAHYPADRLAIAKVQVNGKRASWQTLCTSHVMLYLVAKGSVGEKERHRCALAVLAVVRLARVQ